jgi:adenine-specific DNA-methyltransferase
LVSYDLADDTEYPLRPKEKKQIMKRIESLRILDPACGSGAYPIGALQKIVYILQQVDPDCKMWLEKKLKGIPDLYKQKIINEVKQNPFDYIRKLDVIKNSIFGVDIQPIAVDVSRLRCFLTLVVESEIDDSKPNRGIEPLPNLDFKFVCANTLIQAPEHSNPDDNSLFGDDFQEKLASAVDRYFSSSGENKRSANNEIHKLIDNKVEEKLNHLKNLVSYNGDKKMESLLAKTNKKQIDQHSSILVLWSSYKNIFENKPVGFFDPKYFFPSIKDKFDLIIGNPPYIKEYTDKSVFNGLRESPYYQGKTDLWSMFTAISIDYLKNEGTLSFIGPNNWATNAGSSILRNKIIKETQIIDYIDFGDFKVFEQAGIQTMILILNKIRPQEKYKVSYLKIADKNENTEIVYEKMFGVKTKIELAPESLINRNLTFSTSEFSTILDKIKSKSNFRLSEQEVAQGIVADPDKAFIFNPEQDFNSNEKECLKKYFTSVSKFTSGKQRGLIAYLSKSKNIDIDQVENIKEQLLNYEKELKNRREVKNGRLYWFNLHWPRDERFFEKGPKIVCGVRVMVPSFFYTEDEYYGSRALNFIKTERVNLKYLVGILNSKISYFWLKNRGKQLGDLMQVDKGPLLEIPLFVGSKDQQDQVVRMVDQIIDIKKQNPESDTKELESKVDNLVMDIYSLSDKEKEVIKNFN